MSKGDGLKIGIKFTDDLVGDVSDNINAFTITGKEYQWVDGPDNNGPLLDKEYQIDKVERYPIQRIWELGEELTLESIGEITEVVGWNTDVFGTGNPSTGTRGYKFKPTNDCLVTKLRIFPTETTSTVHLWDVSAQTLLITKTFTTITGRWNEISLDLPIQIYSNKEYIVSANYTSGKNYYRNKNPQQSEFNELIYTGFFIRSSHNVFPTDSTTWGNAVDIVMQIGETEYVTPKTYTSQGIALKSEYKIRWLEDKPVDTNIIIEYTTGATQGQWQEISNGEIITSNTNLWIRATLSTEDTAIAPILQDLWLEEPDTPQDKILITMDWWGRFNNALGNIKVQYDSTKGTLQGSGGPVKSFTEEFMPTGLVQKPNPGPVENFKITAATAVDFIKIEYNNRYAAENFKITAAATITLTFVGVVNP